MKKPVVKLTVERSSDAFWACAEVKGGVIATFGDTLDEMKTKAVEATNLFYEDKGISYTVDELQFSYDVKSFFEHYGIINAKALALRIGMSQSLLSQYANGIKHPSAKQVNRIMEGLRGVGRELANLELT